ncbi:MAG: hypothetical protein IJR00_11820 [Lachnospiraceae bacterium]|nr:hypothetical protein [Lachnospiraceae bacterium]
MYECVNCAAPLRFDIDTQALLCDSCGSHFDPSTFHDAGKEVETPTDYDVRVFTCPQCAGEIMAINTTAATFCSFCGANVILTERISIQKKPEYIIPFRKNKNDCINAYKKMLRRSLFAPRALRDQDHLSRFTGIYMPYWLFGAEVDDTVTIPGKTALRADTAFEQSTRYALKTQIQASYFGASRDASRGFTDVFSDAVSPFDSSELKPFSPAYFCGFFADIHDIPSENYKEDVTKMIASHLYRSVATTGELRNYDIDTENVSDKVKIAYLRLKEMDVQRAFFPVWFLTYRKQMGKGDDRVAYAVVNGQTGRIAADIPVSEGKYLIFSLLLAIPLFLMIHTFLPLTPRMTLLFAAAAAIVTFYLFRKEVHDIALRDLRLRRELAGYAKERESKSEKKADVKAEDRMPGIPCMIAAICALIVLFWHPLRNIWYYGTSIAAYLCIFVTLFSLIRKYNLLATRPLPDFHMRTWGRAIPIALLISSLLFPAYGRAAEEAVILNDVSGLHIVFEESSMLAETMKIAANAMFALFLSAILNYLLLRRVHRLRTPDRKEIIDSMQITRDLRFRGAEVTGPGPARKDTSA